MSCAGGMRRHFCPILLLFVFPFLWTFVHSRSSGITECVNLSKAYGGSSQYFDNELISHYTIQGLFDCLNEVEEVVFRTEVLDLSSPLTLRKPVKTKFAKERYNAPRMFVKCPENGPAIRIRSEGVVLSDLDFRHCNLEGSSIIDIFPGSNVTLRNCIFSENIIAGGHGCVSVRHSTLHLDTCSFLFNAGENAGAVHAQSDSVVHISNSLFERNSAKLGGAVTLVNSQGSVRESMFVANEADVQGGAIHLAAGKETAVLNVQNVQFERNRVLGPAKERSSGGALYVEGKVKTFIDTCTFNENFAQDGGGALFSGNTTLIKVSNSSFIENTAKHGGAIAAPGFTQAFNMSVTASLFKNNSVPDGFGGALFLGGVDPYSVHLGEGTEFIKNYADEGSAIWAQATSGPSVKLTVDNAVFKENKAGEMGAGALATVGQVIAVVNNVTFEENSAHMGGAINVFERGRMNITCGTFIANHAGAAGGAVFFLHNDHNVRSFQQEENMVVFMDECVFINNTAGSALDGIPGPILPSSLTGGGGAITITGAGTHVELNHSLIQHNTAIAGGGICWMQSGSFLIGDVDLIDNRAVHGGAINAQTLDGITEDFEVRSGNFTGNSARRGGAMSLFVVGNPFKYLVNLDYAMGRTARFIDVDFTGNRASEIGGAVDVVEVLFSCEGCNFQLNRAGLETAEAGFGGKGGAISVGTKATAMLRDSKIEGNSADDGGGVFVKDGVLNANDVEFADNVADNLGGAVALEYGATVTTPSGILMNATSCNMTGNRARVGGGINFAVQTPQEKFGQCANLESLQEGTSVAQQEVLDLVPVCQGISNFQQLLDKRHIHLEDTVLGHNQAHDSGAAIYTNNPGLVEICCGGVCKLVEDGSMQQPCKNAKSARWVNNVIIGNNPQTVISAVFSQVELLPSKIKGHSSGQELEPIEVILRDPFWQIASGKNVSLVVKAEDPRIISGNPTAGIFLNDGDSMISGINMRAQPGDYTLQFLFSEEGGRSIVGNISVEVRDCWLGEVYEDASLTCLHCDPTTYSFDPYGSCRMCPENAICNASTLVPMAGFWHANSQSDGVKECLYEGACMLQDRELKLGGAAFLAHRGGLMLHWNDGDYRQCAQGYNGPLCGSCVDGYGRIGAAECGKCPGRVFSIFLVLLAFAVLLCIVAYLTRQALKYAEQLETSLSKKQLSPAPRLENRRKAIELQSSGSGRVVVESLINSAPEIRMELAEDTEAGQKDEGIGSKTKSANGLHRESYRAEFKDGGEEMALEDAEASTSDRGHFQIGIEIDGRFEGKSAENPQRLESNRTMEVLKILINFLQVIGTAATINVDWTESVFRVLALSDYVSGVSSGNGLLSFECAFDTGTIPRSIKSFLAQTLSPFVIWIILAAFWGICTWRKRLNQQQMKQRFIVAMLVILYVIYINTTKKVVRMFNCIHVDLTPDVPSNPPQLYWAEDTDVVCYRNAHAWLVGTVGSSLLIIVVIGFPLGLIWKLHTRKADLNDVEFVGRHGFLYKAYRESACFWEAFVLLRKGVLATIVVFTEALGPEQQTTLAAIALAFFLLLHNQYKPYNDTASSKLNSLESWSLTVSMFVCLTGVLFSQNKGRRIVQVGLSAAVLIAILGFVLFLVYQLGLSSVEMARDVIQKWMVKHGLGTTGNAFRDVKIAGGHLIKLSDKKLEGVSRKIRPLVKERKLEPDPIQE